MELVLIGVVAGFLAGFFGVGGGMITVPLLLYTGISIKFAIGISSMQMVFSFDTEDYVDPVSNDALLRLADPVGTPAVPASAQARVGELVLAVGRPSPGGVQASLGVVTAMGSAVTTFRQEGGGHGPGDHPHRQGGRGFFRRMGPPTQTAGRYIRTDAIPYPGFSGGPLVDANGHIIGLNTSGLVRGLSLAIPVDRAFAVAQALHEHGSVKRGYLGVRSQTVSLPEDQQNALGREQATGLLLVWIEAGSSAAQGGLLVGDILVALAGERVSDPGSLQAALYGVELGEAIPVEVLRGGQPTTRMVAVGER